MLRQESQLRFGPDRSLGHAVGMVSHAPNDSATAGFPIIWSSDEVPLGVSALEFGASDALYENDPLVCHSYELQFVEADVTFRDLVLLHRVATTVKKSCILRASGLSLKIQKL